MALVLNAGLMLQKIYNLLVIHNLRDAQNPNSGVQEAYHQMFQVSGCHKKKRMAINNSFGRGQQLKI